MSTVSTILGFPTKEKSKKHSRRSSSETRASQNNRRSSNRGRVPIFEIEKGSDVVTKVCEEIGRTILNDPDISTGRFLATLTEANSPMNQSDIVLLVTAAVMEHLGNRIAANKLLSHSGTVSTYYARMGLQDNTVRSLFVTMLIAMSPVFATMIEKTVKVSLTRAMNKSPNKEADEVLGSALSSLHGSSSITDREMMLLSNKVDTIKLGSMLENKEGASTIVPDESASQITPRSVRAANTEFKRVVNQSDLMDFIKRNKTGKRLSFEEEFPYEKKPVRSNAVKKSHGIGYSSDENLEADIKNVGMSDLMTAANTGINMNYKAESASPTIQKTFAYGPINEDSFTKTPTEFYAPRRSSWKSSSSKDTGSSDSPYAALRNPTRSEIKAAPKPYNLSEAADSLLDLV